MSKKNPTQENVVITKKQQSSYDAAKLRKLVKEGKTAREIMEALEISHSQVLKHHLLKLCATDQTYYDVPGLYNRNSRKAYVNAKGEIKLKMSNIDFGNVVFKPETEFDVTVTETQVILTVLSPGTSRQSEGEESTEDLPQ